MEDTFIKIGKGEGAGNEKIYKLDPMKKNLIENFLYARENMLLMAKGTVDANGKSTIVDRATGRPIYVGEGLIPQVERFEYKQQSKPVLVYDKQGNFIGEYKSESSAAKELNCHKSQINRVLRGVAYSHNNYVFKWKS